MCTGCSPLPVVVRECRPHHTTTLSVMTRQARSLAQLTGALGLMAAAYGFALAVPAHKLPQQQRTAAGLMVLVGALLAPAGLIVGAARDAQA